MWANSLVGKSDQIRANVVRSTQIRNAMASDGESAASGFYQHLLSGRDI
jgi:hypothetical protein